MKKIYKDYYKFSKKPLFFKTKSINTFVVHGEGEPMSESFQLAINLLYKLSYAIRMKGKVEKTYEPYSVAPLEGIYTMKDGVDYTGKNKDQFVWKLFINQPPFVNKAMFNKYVKPLIEEDENFKKVKFEKINEGNVVQIGHTGSYDSEPETLKSVFKQLEERKLNYLPGSHHEIYLSDARKTEESKRKTIVRYKVINK